MADQSAILATAKAHFYKMQNQEIEIPEWSEDQNKPLVAYYSAPSLKIRQEITKRSKGQESRQMALTLILCLEDEERNKMFADNAENLAALISDVDPAVIARVAKTILGLTDESDLGN